MVAEVPRLGVWMLTRSSSKGRQKGLPDEERLNGHEWTVQALQALFEVGYRVTG